MRATLVLKKYPELNMRLNSYTFSFLTFCILVLIILPLAECYNNPVLSRVCYVDSEMSELVCKFEKKKIYFLFWISEVWFSINYNNLIIEKSNNTSPLVTLN